MQMGVSLREGERDQVLLSPKHEYTRQLLEAVGDADSPIEKRFRTKPARPTRRLFVSALLLATRWPGALN